MNVCHACHEPYKPGEAVVFSWRESAGIRIAAFFCSMYCVPTLIRRRSA